MPRSDYEVRITPSVLDRLIDEEPEISREPPASRAKNLRQLKQSVRRDLEWLLNTRQWIEEIPPELEETRRSLATYGLPDFSALSVNSPADQKAMRRLIEDEIRFFEPRLIDVEISLETARDAERSLHFRINARLRVDPSPEPVVFDTTVHLFKGEYTVRGE